MAPDQPRGPCNDRVAHEPIKSLFDVDHQARQHLPNHHRIMPMGRLTLHRQSLLKTPPLVPHPLFQAATPHGQRPLNHQKLA